jgi:exportin-1
LVEKRETAESVTKALHYLVMISEVEDVELFKICLEYWNSLAADLYKENPYGSPGQRRAFYASILSKVRFIMISRMAKPEEVLVVENENGEVVREFMKDTNSINLYKNMRETLVYLTHLDYFDTERIMTEKLNNQVTIDDIQQKLRNDAHLL